MAGSVENDPPAKWSGAMSRREFVNVLAGTIMLWPLPAFAQQTCLPVVGFLNSASADGYAAMAAAFKKGLKEAGYFKGQNVIIEYRWADNNYERLPALAADLVNLRVNVIFANSPSIPAALAATKSIPIIFNSGDDPVRLGFVGKSEPARWKCYRAWLFFPMNWRRNG
jgi:putative tryptophan/tyrosine transport system substrate-binding protein